jgi:small-conductance mechanosensitive channel
MELTKIFQVIEKIFGFTLFEINQTPVTLSSIIMFIIVITVFYFASKLINKMMVNMLLKHFDIEDNTRFLLLRITHYIIMIIGVILSFQFIGINLSGLAVVFGLLSVGIGFGLQNVTSNFVAGVILLFEQPIRIGDRVTIGNTEGDVTAINFRSTTIQSLNNITIIVPNSEFISKEVINWSHGDLKIRIDIDIGVSYNSDLDKVLSSLKEVAEENNKVLKHPEPDVLFKRFGDSSWDMILRVWIANPKMHHHIRSEINCAIVHKFRKNNIEIPFPQRDLHLRTPDTIAFIQADKKHN